MIDTTYIVAPEVANFSLDTLSMVGTPSQGFIGEMHILNSNLRNDISLLLVIAFLFTAFSFRHGYRYFEALITGAFSTKKRDNVFEHRTMSETSVLVALLLNTVIQMSVILLFWLHYQIGLQLNANAIQTLGICIATSCGFLMMKYLLYRLMSYTFGSAGTTKMITETFNSIWALSGIFLLPISVMLTYHNISYHILINCAFSLFLVAHAIFIIKAFRIFFSKIDSILLFILYLCTLEIVPFIIYINGTIYFCN